MTQGIVAEFASEDPLVHNKTYGVIQNPNVKASLDVTNFVGPSIDSDSVIAKNRSETSYSRPCCKGSSESLPWLTKTDNEIHFEGVDASTINPDETKAGREE